MSNHKMMYRCPLCGNQFQINAHVDVDDGKYIPRYDITVCRTCWNSNWDGWAPHYEETLIAHLKKKGLPVPERNEKGWLPRE